MKKHLFLLLALCACIMLRAQNYTWTQMPAAPFPLYGAAYITIDYNIYVICGVKDHIHTPVNMNHQVWAFDALSQVWIQKHDFPGTSVYDPSSFAINGYGYIVNGWDSTTSGGSTRNECWRYDPSTDTWARKASFPGTGRYTCASFADHGKGYVACGFSPYTNEVYQYDPVADSWTQKGNFPGIPRQATTQFTINGTTYVGMGACSGASIGQNFFIQSDWYKYESATDTWVQLGYFPGNPTLGSYTFVLNGEAYMVCGINQNQLNTQTGASNEFWKYTPATDTWTMIGLFPDTPIAGGASGVVNGAAYMGLGENAYYGNYKNKWWRYGYDSAGSCQTTAITKLKINNTTYNFQAVPASTYSPTTVISWHFGDGGSATGTSVIHQFPSSGGMFGVYVTGSDTAYGCRHTFSDTVVIVPDTSCSVGITYSSFNALYNLAAAFTGASPFTFSWTTTNTADTGFWAYANTVDPLAVAIPNATTSYCVHMTDANGCHADNCINIMYIPSGSQPCQVFLYIYPDPNLPGSYIANVYDADNSPLTYYWTLGNGYTTTDSFFSYTYPLAGNYSICLTVVDTSGCSASYCDSSFYAWKVGGGPIKQINTRRAPRRASGIADVAEVLPAVYPNPAQSDLTIDLHGSKVNSVAIYNMAGQKLKNIASPVSNKIQISDLAEGIYWLDVRSQSGESRIKFVKTDR